MAVGVLASFTLTMAVNTAYVASAELVEQVSHRYSFTWIVERNPRGALYRIHLANAALYTGVILITRGSQGTLAEMYAVGLVASFVINMGALLIYRYRRGTLLPESGTDRYRTSRFITLILFLVLLGCLLYLAYTKPYGLAMWAAFTAMSLLIGVRVARKRAPEISQRRQSDTPMDLVLFLAEQDEGSINVHFRRPQEHITISSGDAYVSFYQPRLGIPPAAGTGHFRFALERIPLRQALGQIIELLHYEFPDRQIVLHFGWPMSSWWDRLSTGVVVHTIMRLPQKYPYVDYRMEYQGDKKPDDH